MEKNQRLRCVVFDLDGTLLDDDKHIKKESLLAIQEELVKNDVKIILASGRHYCDVEPYLFQIGINNISYITCCDGLYVFNSEGQLIKKFAFIQPECLFDICKFFKRVTVFCENGDYIIGFSPLFSLRYFYLRFIKGVKRVRFLKRKSISSLRKIEKVRFYCSNDKWCTLVAHGFNVVPYSKNEFDILNSKTGKYFAIKFIAETMGIDLNQFLYFGNDYNDLDCFFKLKFTVAMGNSPYEIKKNALFVTSSNNEDGISRAIKHFESFYK